mmetsp:Transcript_1171/g.3309  ORF Transcript_1171/g.3309 Transcript_1171/m.3309 type:complete len:206 (-) Transcript_1171:634-1251(-)|eukprot:CAMPEP_0185831750 /NCGR_PEP_ID=MMETSP1353-20130828/1686_1 /TAXON_ID=1077150 /ORGANISM="Erythrolobus australicus, Strain CCMP3124" /LENGTH=205 /DNA_ID=CAMNT_0028529857 /DNA_START=37 /DNA_END=654 /DNA_ORIENTATION=-
MEAANATAQLIGHAACDAASVCERGSELAAKLLPERVMLVILLLAPLIPGMFVGFMTRDAVLGWYQRVRKPWFTPPDFAFGPIWSSLYLGMGYASFLVYKATVCVNGVLPYTSMALYVMQLALNVAWSLIFFNAMWWRAALVEIAVLWLAIAACAAAFASADASAGALMLPYLAFVTLAAGLNAEIIRMNRDFSDKAKPRTKKIN